MKKKAIRMFSLVELMVVIVILGLLGGIVGINVFKHVGEAKIATTRATIVEYSKAIDLFYMNTGKYPASLEDLNTKPEGTRGWKGPYIKGSIINDAWHNPFVLNVNTGDKNKPYVVYSYGPDGMDGGGDDIYEKEDEEDAGGGGGDGSPATDGD